MPWVVNNHTVLCVCVCVATVSQHVGQAGLSLWSAKVTPRMLWHLAWLTLWGSDYVRYNWKSEFLLILFLDKIKEGSCGSAGSMYEVLGWVWSPVLHIPDIMLHTYTTITRGGRRIRRSRSFLAGSELRPGIHGPRHREQKGLSLTGCIVDLEKPHSCEQWAGSVRVIC